MTDVAVLVLWILAVLLTWAGVVLAVFATRPKRHWLVVPSAIPVVGTLAFVMIAGGVPDAPVGLLGALHGLGLGLIGVIAGSPAVTLILRFASRDTVVLGAHGGILVRRPNEPAPAPREILRGGTTIGYLERIALIGSVVVGQAAAVAVIVAVKGLGRFSELENEQARERFIIGTLASLVWAGVCTAAIMLAA
ncbi:hypothetical protein CLV46_2042 [Diaminobutyricimonas aerilata]|uniref:Uncharacterized protein n=1 Tax=Diaminobutyricimonas aerilata TaxID=1162967 RepID=A0A2M9CKQ4_9MICO|nr:hypothetical protein [Diaminobutyricimonas aerilata]PJJ72470.1 hypothetical protein CLV46_2042 [Diaminobutyricimonas aerilata]